MNSLIAQPNNAITVLVADEQPLFRYGLSSLLSNTEGFERVASVADGDEAVKVAQEILPDVAMVSADLPKLSGIETTRRIKAYSTRTAVVILGAHKQDQCVLASIQAGAAAYMLKTAPLDELVDVARKVHAGRRVFDIEVTANILTRLAANDAGVRSRPFHLHEREVQILKLVAKGGTNKEISRELHISEHTVGTHLVNIFRKLRVESRTSAVLSAVYNGYIAIEDLAPSAA